MLSLRIFAVLMFITVWYILECRSDPVEGSRLLEESFRDYDKRIRPNYGGSPVIVNVSIHILSIPEIDTASMTFTVSFFIRQIWTDPRLTFNSRRNIDTITLDASTSERIWSPDTFFVNELSSVSHDILVKNQFCRISQQGTVLLSRRVTLTAYANMDSSLFPYDSHSLVLDLESYGSQTKDLKYQWAEEAVSSSFMTSPGFQVKSLVATDTSLTTSTGSYSRLSVRINTKRTPLSYELGVMLPTGLLALLCWGSLQFKNATVGTLTVVYLISLIILLNGLILTISSIPFLSSLQLYSLLSAGFGLLCLIVNIKNERKGATMKGKLNEKSDGSKSRTESTSENCKVEGLPYGATMDDNEEDDNQRVTRGEQKRKNFTKCMQQCRSDMGRDKCIRYSLLAALLTMNVVYFVIFRLLR